MLSFFRSTLLPVMFCALAALALSWFPDSVSAGAAQTKAQDNAAKRQTEKNGTAAEVARGKYIVENVAMCGQCHTPADSNGNPDRSRWLQGTPVPYMPARPNSDWPISVPRIGGTLPATDAEMITLLMTGLWTNGNRLRLPMPQFRLDRADAEAVVAYLKTVKPQP